MSENSTHGHRLLILGQFVELSDNLFACCSFFHPLLHFLSHPSFPLHLHTVDLAQSILEFKRQHTKPVKRLILHLLQNIRSWRLIVIISLIENKGLTSGLDNQCHLVLKTLEMKTLTSKTPLYITRYNCSLSSVSIDAWFWLQLFPVYYIIIFNGTVDLKFKSRRSTIDAHGLSIR